jgi:hypothetical protein
MRGTPWSLAAFMVAASVATAQEVSVNWDKTYDFSKLKTFAVQVGSEAEAKDPFLEKHFVSTVTSTLASKGWAQADAAAADALVVLHGKSETRRRLEAYGTGGYRWGGGMGSAQLEDYKVGTIVVDVFDAKTKTLLFRGAAGDEMSDKAEKNEKKIDKGVSKMFKEFPPGSKK